MERTYFGRTAALGWMAALTAALLVASALAASPSGASNVGGGGCVAADANRTVVGSASGGKGSNASSAYYNELVGQSCFYRKNATQVQVGLTWHGVGRVLEGSMTSVLYDCTAKKWVSSKNRRLSYPNGSTHNYGSATIKTFTVTKGHKYKVRLEGYGQYRRYPNGSPSAVAGHFYPSSANANVPKWVGWSTCA
jgi:hypothetical protein